MCACVRACASVCAVLVRGLKDFSLRDLKILYCYHHTAAPGEVVLLRLHHRLKEEEGGQMYSRHMWFLLGLDYSIRSATRSEQDGSV